MAHVHKAPETFLMSAEAREALPRQAQQALHQVDQLKYFLISAPVDYSPEQFIKRFLLPTGEYVSCVLWNGLFHISGTDIVRCLAFRFQAFGRPVKNPKKFEEGVFSDLRNLKAGTDAALEEPKSPFLDFLYKNNCIRTQKKQKVFFWYSVPHDRLFLDALERDLKRDTLGQEATTAAFSEPALSFDYDPTISLYDQLTKAQQGSLPSFSEARRPSTKSASAEARAADSMRPPQTVPLVKSRVPEGSLSDMRSYSQIPTPNRTPAAPSLKMSHDHLVHGTPYAPLGRDAMPPRYSDPRLRSMPPSINDYSPAPSFHSSYSYQDPSEEHSTQHAPYEPLTPPQYAFDYDASISYAQLSTPMSQSTAKSQQSYMIESNRSRLSASSMRTNLFNAAGQREGQSHFSNGSGSVQNRPLFKQITKARRNSELRRSISASVHSTGDDVVPVQRDNHEHGDRGSFGGCSQGNWQYGVAKTGPLHTTNQHVGAPMMLLQQHMLRGNTVVPETYAASTYPMAAPMLFRRARSATLTVDSAKWPDKAHSCPILECGKTFRRLEHLKRHVRTHTQERPFVCEKCAKAFSRSDNLAQHRRTHDTGSAPARDNTISEDEELSSYSDLEPGTSSMHPDYLTGMQPLVFSTC